MLILHSSNKWILLCVNLVVTVVPRKPSDVSFVGKEDAHRMIFAHLDCKRCVDRRRLCSPFFTSVVVAVVYWLVSVTCCWLFLAVTIYTAKLRVKISDSEITP